MDHAVEKPLYTYFDFSSQREAIHPFLEADIGENLLWMAIVAAFVLVEKVVPAGPPDKPYLRVSVHRMGGVAAGGGAGLSARASIFLSNLKKGVDRV